jgi:F-box-like
MSILELPIEILEKILKYTSNRHNVQLTCRYFYEVVCMIEKNFYYLDVNDEAKVIQEIIK